MALIIFCTFPSIPSLGPQGVIIGLFTHGKAYQKSSDVCNVSSCCKFTSHACFCFLNIFYIPCLFDALPHVFPLLCLLCTRPVETASECHGSVMSLEL